MSEIKKIIKQRIKDTIIILKIYKMETSYRKRKLFDDSDDE
jgi:hypothetical protein